MAASDPDRLVRTRAAGAAWTQLGGLVPHRVDYLSGGTGDILRKKKGPRQR